MSKAAVAPAAPSPSPSPIVAFNPALSLNGAQRRAIQSLTRGQHGWRYHVTPSTGPAQELILYRPYTHESYVIERDGSWSRRDA